MTTTDFGLFDADNHYYETPDCFTRHIESSMRDRAIHVESRDGEEIVLVGERPFTFLDNPFPQVIAKPGALREMLKAMSSGNIAESDAVAPIGPACIRRDDRLELMDEQGVESILLFPTLAVCVEHFMKDDPDQLYANFHAFNLWLAEEWGFDHDGRIFAAPLVSLRDVDRAVAELDSVLAAGARA